MPAEGGTLTRLTRSEGWDLEPAWSPDGKRVASIGAPGFDAGPLRIIAAEDATAVALSKDVLARGRVQFHSDGTKLLGFFALTGQPSRLHWYGLSSGTLSPVTTRAAGVSSLRESGRDPV